MVGEGTLEIHLVLDAVDEPGPLLTSTLPMMMNGMGRQMVNDNLNAFGVELEGNTQWNAQEGILEATYRITGIVEAVEKQLGLGGEKDDAAEKADETAAEDAA